MKSVFTCVTQMLLLLQVATSTSTDEIQQSLLRNAAQRELSTTAASITAFELYSGSLQASLNTIIHLDGENVINLYDYDDVSIVEINILPVFDANTTVLPTRIECTVLGIMRPADVVEASPFPVCTMAT